MSSPAKVQQVLEQLQIPAQVREMPSSTRSAAEAAATLGCAVEQIAKSIIFRADDGRAVLVIASGGNRVSSNKVANLLGQKISKADADFVREKTGYAIGGVPPVGHDKSVAVFLDDDLRKYDIIWAAAGSPFSVFYATPAQLANALCVGFSDIKE